MTTPIPTPIYRMLHIDNLAVLLQRGGMHAPCHVPDDGLPYKTIHNLDIQNERHVRPIPCGPGGTLHDYVPFYLGPRSPMLLQLHTGRVDGYTEGQAPLIYLVTTAQALVEAGCGYVFSDGHGIARFTDWYADLDMLENLDWDMIYERYWSDDVDDMDRQRRKQAEFLVHQQCPWNLIREIAVINNNVAARVREILSAYPNAHRPDVQVRSVWYY
ncbi:type II toxin-antitoxin system toxin DNA ADP-ribosyl transferase DarT [Geobacter argillaceus]|uniref:Uncharacterized protein DUF4433 n=1 Tax=Geobacter argillaceus TaxID=345631 RepID=A0A562WR24_9BACT|nr:DUF4433 domain-containing protein [Geobacter argillaceus]TWJ32652.1 uncharacterized protein DUF4433 [Geobacter argillaceus]